MGYRALPLAVAISITLVSNVLPQLAKADAARVDKLVSEMSLDEKITLLGGIDDFYTRPIERLNIPRIKMTDGPNGTRVNGESTAYPAGVLLAATWDPKLAMREGEQLGRDARARGCHVLLGPGVNIYRHPRCGRNFEYFGEDPLLAGEIGAGYVNGVQSQGVSATVKHFAGNNQELDRNASTSEIDERTLREIYLPAFKRIIDQAHPGAIMCSYNRLNGTYASANRWLLTDLLRDEWKFNGIVMSDWGAVHGTLGPLMSGLDLEMPRPDNWSIEKVKPLIENGVASPDVIDVKVRRLVSWMDRFGWLEKEIKDESIPLNNPEGARVALEVARGGLTLLKNENAVLPLDKRAINSVVVIGPNAKPTPVGGGGSGYTSPFDSVSIVQGLRSALGEHRVTLIQTNAVDKLVSHPVIDAGSITAEYFPNENLEGAPVVKRGEPAIRIRPLPSGKESVVEGLAPGKFSVRYRATITPGGDADFTFFTRSDDGVRVLLDGRNILDDWGDHAAHDRSAVVSVKAGQPYLLTVEYFDSGGEASLEFGCGPMPQVFEPGDLQKLRDADAVVFCAGFSQQTEGEGSDRSYALPDGQDDLINRVAQENAKTIVVLNGGGSCDMAPWIDRVPALLHAYYAGQEGGTAIADVLIGAVNPSGRLPFTIEKQLSDVPSEGHWGNAGVVEYVEGLFVGYRGFDRKNLEPRFPFGFGLSYTSFELGEISAKFDGEAIVVSVDVSNTGSRDGASVVQCYVEPPADELIRPVRELRGFEKVELRPGEKRHVELRIPRTDLSYWDVQTHGWKLTPGEYGFVVGFNSRDLAKSVTLTVE